MEFTDEMLDALKEEKVLQDLFKKIGYKEEKTDEKYIESLRKENAEKRIRNKELLARIEELENKAGEYETQIKTSKAELEKQLSELKSENEKLNEFRGNIFNKKLAEIPDETLRAELEKTGSLDLVEKTLELVIKTNASPGAQNKQGIEKPDFSKMTVQELEAMAINDPDSYRTYVSESFRKI